MDAEKFQENLDALKSQALSKIQKAENLEILEEVRIWLFGRKGKMNELFDSVVKLEPNLRAHFGQALNSFKVSVTETLAGAKKEIQDEELASRLRKEKIDITVPGKKRALGHLHPLTLVLRRIENIFKSYGFQVVEGPEMETEYYNFDALNIPANHPARDLQDTFWLKQKPWKGSKDHLLLRTQTSAMQARFLEKNQPPMRIIVPGRVFRYEATDASHDIQFHQIEGLMIASDISLVNLIGVLEDFFKKFFGRNLKMRIRPGYFPFVEPGIEVDIKLGDSDWLEVAGAGMVHPKVLETAHLVPGEVQGFAFGMGWDRLAMLYYGISDIRLFFSGDERFLRQF